MVTRPDPIELSEEERRIVALYLREKPRLATRNQVKAAVAGMWKAFMANAREELAIIEQAKARRTIEDDWEGE